MHHSEVVMQRSKIEVVPYDPAWPEKFRKAAGKVEAVLGANLVAIHHIGSTSIVGIYAKPVIDMVMEVADIDELDGRSADMEALGYEVKGEFGIAGRRYFRRNDPDGRRAHQIHAFAAGSPPVTRHLAFRDFLLEHPDFAEQYSDLKCRLAEEHPYDMNAYMDGKDGFIKDMEARALRWA